MLSLILLIYAWKIESMTYILIVIEYIRVFPEACKFWEIFSKVLLNNVRNFVGISSFSQSFSIFFIFTYFLIHLALLHGTCEV